MKLEYSAREHRRSRRWEKKITSCKKEKKKIIGEEEGHR